VPTRYHPRSPLAAITALRTVGGAGGSLVHMRATASELLTLASDQFTRGIFHMPHSPTPTTTTRAAHAAPPRRRQQVLYTLATEVLVVAERLENVAARARWAAWADALLLQMHMEADVDAWRVRVGAVRGRCWLVIGGARADEMEDALERGEVSVLASKEAEEARTGLNTGEYASSLVSSIDQSLNLAFGRVVAAISFFDRAKGSASTESSDKSLVDMQPWVRAILTLFFASCSLTYSLLVFLVCVSSRKPSSPWRISRLTKMLAKRCMRVRRQKVETLSRAISAPEWRGPEPQPQPQPQRSTSEWTNHDNHRLSAPFPPPSSSLFPPLSYSGLYIFSYCRFSYDTLYTPFIIVFF